MHLRVVAVGAERRARDHEPVEGGIDELAQPFDAGFGIADDREPVHELVWKHLGAALFTRWRLLS